MAVDVALMQRARESGEAVFRIYSWAEPTLSLGRNQTAEGKYDLDRIREQGVQVVRRPTGGRAILHWREITYSVTAPAMEAVGLRQSYELINRVLLDGLGRLGVQVNVAEPTVRAERPSAAPCFAEPSAGEMVTDGRKLVGSAQWREDGALLQHGSILVDDDQSGLLSSLMVVTPPPVPRPATLRGVLGWEPTALQVAERMFEAVRGLEDPEADWLDAQEVVCAGTGAYLDHFLDRQWTWRR